MKKLATLAIACVLTSTRVFAAGDPAPPVKVKAATPCAKTIGGCPKAMAVPRDNDPGIMPADMKGNKGVAKKSKVSTTQSAQVKQKNLAPNLKNEKALPVQ